MPLAFALACSLPCCKCAKANACSFLALPLEGVRATLFDTHGLPLLRPPAGTASTPDPGAGTELRAVPAIEGYGAMGLTADAQEA